MSFKYRLRPSRSKEVVLNQWFGCVRLLWNLALEQRKMIDYKELRARSLSSEDTFLINYYYQAAELRSLKAEFPFFREVPSQSLQQTLKQLDGAFSRFFKGVSSYPKPKKRGKREAGIKFPQATQFSIGYHPTNKRKAFVTLPKLGRMKFECSRTVLGKIKNATITKDGQHYYISFQVETEIPKIINTGSNIGIDRGIIHTIATSEGSFFDLPVVKIKTIESKITLLQQQQSKKVKFSSNWRRLKNKINRCHKRITNVRKDFLWKTANNLTKNHGTIVLEALKIKNMSASASGTIDNPGKMIAQKSGLNRSILRQGWFDFETKLRWQAEKNGSYILTVNPNNTSRRCSVCGHTEKDNRKTQDTFHCQKCNHIENADTNAAKNILALGTSVTAFQPTG